MRLRHSYRACLSFFAVRDSFLQDDPLVPAKLPALSLWVVVWLMRLVLRYRIGGIDTGVAAWQLLRGCHCFLICPVVGDGRDPGDGVRVVMVEKKRVQ